MAKEAYLVLEDGSVFRGEPLGAETSGYGEVVFNTSMTGYQEVLTDPSYAGQIVVLTYPLVGNYGINAQDFESRRIQVAGFVVRNHCDYPSHGLSTGTLHEFLASQGIPGIKGVDTRAITRRLRSQGVKMGLIRSAADAAGAGVQGSSGATSRAGVKRSARKAEWSPEAALASLRGGPQYGEVDYVKSVTTHEYYTWHEDSDAGASGRRIVVVDVGLKYNILRLLRSRGCEVMAVPATTSADEILALSPSGVVLSPGPGDPALLDYVVSSTQKLIGRVPIMGICLGHQVVARALGGNTFKLKFGHRGANHPVKELATGNVSITAQNHGYAVDGDSLPPGLEVTHINLNDGTVEGMVHRELPILTIQYHSEASPGPRDNEHLFDRFLEMTEQAKRHGNQTR